MAREEFIDNLRRASRLLPPPGVSSHQGAQTDAMLSARLHAADLWLTPKYVEGFDPADFADWPRAQREELAKEVAAFRTVAEQVSSAKPATKAQSQQARRHLEQVIKLVRHHLLHEWLNAQQQMMEEATEAAKAKGWHVDQDEKEILESLLGIYQAPRLRIRTQDKEVILDPIARFGSGRQGVVDLVVMPTYETAYMVTYKGNHWYIVSPHGSQHSRPFNRTTLVNTITKLAD
jgi:hypothetical protein